MNGEHEVRLQRIEEMLRELHAKVDRLVEEGAANHADIRWLKWTLRIVLAVALGFGGATVGAAF